MAQGKRKFSAGITLLCFLVSQIFGPDYAHAFPASFPYEVSVKSGFNFDLPPEFGIIESRFLGNRQGTPVIFHIQEPHGDYASQKKIQGILHYLKNHYGVNTLLLEGSAVPLHPELLKFDPQDSKKSLQIAEALAKDSWITGSELFLAREPLAQAYGIEDLAAYNQNGKSLVEVLTQREKSKTFLQSLDLQIKRLQGTYLNPKLRNFISRIEDFEKERIALDAWLPELRGKAKEHLDIHLENPESQIDWPMLVRLFKLQEIEKKLNLGEFEKERKGFLGAIKIRNSKLGIRNQSKNKNSKFKTNPVLDLNHSNLKFVSDLEFRISNLLHQSLSHHQLSDPETGLLFEQMITRLPPDFPHHKYPNVKLFIAHLILQSELHAPALMREVQDLEWKIQKKLAVTPEEKQMVELLKSYRLLDKLLSLRLTGEEYEQMVGSRQEAVSSKQPAVLPPASGILPTALLSRFAALNSSHRVKNLNFRGASEIDTLYEKALEFYRLAKERDGIMVKNIEQYLKSEIRNPKFETNPKAQNLKSQTKKKALVSNLGHSNFEFVSDFGFRVSSLPKAVVVITGGFHSKPLQDYFSSHGYNYALITPKMSGIPKPENAYQNILQTYQENPSTQTATFHQIYWGALEPSEIHAHDRDPELFQRALLRAEVRMNPSLARASDRTSGGRSINKPVDWKIQTFDLIQSLRSRSEMRSTAVAPREQPNIQEMLQRALQLKPDEIKKLRMLYESLTERGKSVLLLSLQYWRETGAWPFRKDLVAFLQAKGYGTTLYTLGVAKLKNSLRISRDIIPVTWKRLGVVRLKGPAQKGDRGKYHSYYVPSESGMKQIQAVIENLSRPSRNTRILPAGILPQLSVVPALATTEHLVDQLGLNPGQDLNAEREYFERLPAVVELGRREAVQYADKLAVILETSRSVPVLEETLLALARMKAYKTVPAIRKKLLFTSTEGIWSHSVRIAAIRALEMLFARDSLPEIAKLLEDKHAGVRMRALQSIGYFLAVPDYESDIRSLAENDPADMIRRFSRDLLLQLLSSRSELRKDERLSEFKNGIEELEAMLKAALDETGSVETAVASIQRSLGFFTDVVVKVNFHPKQNIVVRNKNRPALSLEEEEFLWSAVSDLSRIARLILRETADPWTVQRFKMDTHPLERLLNFRLAGDPDQGNVLWSLEAMYRANLFAGSWYFETSPRWNEVIIGSGHGSEGVGLQDFTAMAKIFQAAATYSSSASLPWPLKFLFIAPAIVVLAGWPGLFWREMRRHEGALGEVRKVIPEKIPATPLSQQDVQERILIVPGSTVKLGNSGLELHLESLNLSKGIVLVKIVRAGNQGAVTLYWENINSPLLPFHETIPAQESFFSWRLKFGHPLILKWGEGDSRIILLLDLPKSGGGVFLKMSPFAVVSPPYAPPVLKPAAARPELRKEVIHPTKRSELRLNIFENPVFADGAEGLQQWFVPGVIGVFILGSIAFGLYLFLTKPSTNKLLKKVGTAAFSLNDLGSLVGQYKKSVNDQTRIVEGLVSLILSKCRFLAGDELAKSEQKMKPTELAFVRKLGETAFQKFASLAASGGWAEVAFKSKLLMHAEKGDPAGKVLEIIYGWFAGLTELNHDKKLGFLHDVLADTFPNWTASAKAAKMLLAFAEQDSGAGEVTEEKGKTKIDYTEGIRSLIRLLPGPNGQSFEPERNYAVVVWELLEIKKEGKHEKWDEPIKQALKRLVRDIIPQAINPIHANTIALLKDSGFLVSVHEGASSSGGVSESEPLRSELRAGLSSSIGSEVRGGSVENLKKLIVEYNIDRSAVFVQGVKNLIRRMEAYEQTPYLETLSGFLSAQSADQAKLLSNAILDFVPEAMKESQNRAGFLTSLMLSLYPFCPKRIRSMIVALTQINSDLYRGRKGTLKGNAFLAFINWLDVFGKQDKAPTKIKELYDALIVQN
ncbi:MAG: HEAT repeat domain-containing protein, partial [Candidatus Omnitrophica bacterium]|nr:HEAT repeat domain-containing protein [Candidatus Omnitrophota bacterium]